MIEQFRDVNIFKDVPKLLTIHGVTFLGIITLDELKTWMTILLLAVSIVSTVVVIRNNWRNGGRNRRSDR